MSTHLLIAAAYLEDLPQGRKLVLMAIADSGDELTLESAPGLPKLRAWSGLTKSAVMVNVTALTEAKLVERISPGRLGRRAVYKVFPQGVPVIPHPTEVAARYAAEPVDNSDTEGIAGDTHRVLLEPSRVSPVIPLQSYPSVSMARRDARLVENRRSTTSPAAFPGARARTDEDRGIARRARGANDVACPVHADQIVPCGRCAYEASQITDEDRLARLAALRRAANPTTEESSA